MFGMWERKQSKLMTAFQQNRTNNGFACTGHSPGTIAFTARGFTTICLGMPTGFARLGVDENHKIEMYHNLNDFRRAHPNNVYDYLNIPVWKHLSRDGHLFVRGIRPRIAMLFTHVFVDGKACFDLIETPYTITEQHQKEIDQ